MKLPFFCNQNFLATLYLLGLARTLLPICSFDGEGSTKNLFHTLQMKVDELFLKAKTDSQVEEICGFYLNRLSKTRTELATPKNMDLIDLEIEKTKVAQEGFFGTRFALSSNGIGLPKLRTPLGMCRRRWGSLIQVTWTSRSCLRKPVLPD